MKLHIGCGERYIPGFIHIDIKKYKNVDVISDISDLSIYDNNSVKMIYCSHVLEHFSRHKIVDVLKEWYRVLERDGILRIAVPNFKALVQVYEQYNDINLILGAVSGGQRDGNDYHSIIFDEKSLTDYLHTVGFKNVKQWDWRSTEHSMIDDYSQAYIPHMDKDNGIHISLNLEAIK